MNTIAITGANRGIGLALSRLYVARGDRVIALCRSPERAESLQRLAEATGRVQLVRIDLADPRAIAAAGGQIEGSIDLLINNAGIFPAGDQSFAGSDPDEWMDALRVMVIGPFLVTRALAPHLAAPGGKVGFVSSAVGSSAWPYGDHYAYASAKAASNRVVRGLAADLHERGILTVSLHPGYVRTDMGGPDADISAEESAEGCAAVLDRLSPEMSGGFFDWTGEAHPF